MQFSWMSALRVRNGQGPSRESLEALIVGEAAHSLDGDGDCEGDCEGGRRTLQNTRTRVRSDSRVSGLNADEETR